MAEPTDEQLAEADRQLTAEGWDGFWIAAVRERALRIAERAELVAALVAERDGPCEACGILMDTCGGCLDRCERINTVLARYR